MTFEELKTKKIGFISLGCDKNRVDAEKMLAKLINYGFEITNNIEDANIIIINTCAFILDAKKESIQTIVECSTLKQNKLEKLIVTGCLPQRNFDEIKQSMPEVDEFVRIKENDNIVKIIKRLYNVVEQKSRGKLLRVLTTHNHYAYLKIADGCNNYCSYCTIPMIRGRYTSVPLEQLVEETKFLAKQGVKELILVAQDVSRYGLDLYKKKMLVNLIRHLSDIKGIEWIRLHYLYPEMIDDELLNEICNNKKVAKYLDIPLQHISDNILSSMNRRSSKQDVINLLNRIKSKNTKIAIRSTFIVGYPGEKSKDFNELAQFLKEYKLDNVGFFAYSREPLTRAYNLKHQVLSATKNHRLKTIQKLQTEVLIENQNSMIGQTLKVMIDEIVNSNTYIARSEFNSPGVDTVIYVNSKTPLKIGDFVNVKIIDRDEIDLIGEIV